MRPSWCSNDSSLLVCRCHPSGTGSMLAAVSTAAMRKPLVVGKPEAFMTDCIRFRCPDLDPARTLMIGDRQALHLCAFQCHLPCMSSVHCNLAVQGKNKLLLFRERKEKSTPEFQDHLSPTTKKRLSEFRHSDVTYLFSAIFQPSAD